MGDQNQTLYEDMDCFITGVIVVVCIIQHTFGTAIQPKQFLAFMREKEYMVTLKSLR